MLNNNESFRNIENDIKITTKRGLSMLQITQNWILLVLVQHRQPLNLAVAKHSHRLHATQRSLTLASRFESIVWLVRKKIVSTSWTFFFYCQCKSIQCNISRQLGVITRQFKLRHCLVKPFVFAEKGSNDTFRIGISQIERETSEQTHRSTRKGPCVLWRWFSLRLRSFSLGWTSNERTTTFSRALVFSLHSEWKTISNEQSNKQSIH